MEWWVEGYWVKMSVSVEGTTRENGNEGKRRKIMVCS